MGIKDSEYSNKDDKILKVNKEIQEYQEKKLNFRESEKLRQDKRQQELLERQIELDKEHQRLKAEIYGTESTKTTTKPAFTKSPNKYDTKRHDSHKEAQKKPDSKKFEPVKKAEPKVRSTLKPEPNKYSLTNAINLQRHSISKCESIGSISTKLEESQD